MNQNIDDLISQLPQLPQLESKKAEIQDSGGNNWKCYCCGDKGIVHPHLARLVIADYDASNNNTPLPLCHHFSECTPNWVAQVDVDNRFDRDICENLHKINLLQWKKHSEQCAVSINERNQKKIKDFTSCFGSSISVESQEVF